MRFLEYVLMGGLEKGVVPTDAETWAGPARAGGSIVGGIDLTATGRTAPGDK